MFEGTKRATMQRAINNGVRWLDGYFGREGWVNIIDSRKLDLSSGRTCVLGQMFQEEHDTLRNNFQWVISSGKMTQAQARTRGFFLPSETAPWAPDNSYYQELTNLWIEKIGELKREEARAARGETAPEEVQKGAIKSPLKFLVKKIVVPTE